MTEPGQVWQLLRDDELLADLVVTGVGFPSSAIIGLVSTPRSGIGHRRKSWTST